MLTPTSELNLPPRKLLNRRSPTLEIKTPDTHLDDEDDLDPYSTDEFRMYEFKIRRCMRSRSHDWTDCPFVHPGEKARRRDPRRFHYSGTPCADFRHGTCPRGDSCEFAHGVFECWLHPARYRTNACKDGRNCKRKVCFFAHTPRQLRVLPIGGSSSGSASSPTTHSSSSPHSHCCEGCSPFATSPTSTLPPISSSNLFSRFNEVALKEENYNFKKALLMELVSSLEAMGITTLEPSGGRGDYGFEWGDGGGEGRGKGGDVLYSDDCLGGMNGPDLEWVNELVM